MINYYLLDVFTTEKYSGNPLAVFLCDESLSSEEMQKIAFEIHFSESVFIIGRKQKNGGYNVRIFTPDTEVPFAGHPSLGAGYVISKVFEERREVKLNLEAGQLLVEVNDTYGSFTQRHIDFGKIFEPNMILSVLELDNKDIDEDYPIQFISSGLPALAIPLKSINALGKCKTNNDKFDELIWKHGKVNLLPFTRTHNGVQTRCFMDDPGHLEDPATGSANAALSGYLLRYNYFGCKDSIEYMVRQGVEMGRESRMYINASYNGGFCVCIGGSIVKIADGEWSINNS